MNKVKPTIMGFIKILIVYFSQNLFLEFIYKPLGIFLHYFDLRNISKNKNLYAVILSQTLGSMSNLRVYSSIFKSVTRSLYTKIDKYITKRFIKNAWLKKSVQYNSDLKSHEKTTLLSRLIWGVISNLLLQIPCVF